MMMNFSVRPVSKSRAARSAAAMFALHILCLPLLITATFLNPRGNAAAADWPQYRADAARSGYVDARPPSDLALRWSYQARHQPAPAWLADDTRMPFDRAYQPVVAGGLLFFGSSVDGKVYALDAATGAQRWTFYTDAPIRFAPAVAEGRVFVAGDDGHLYCLSADTGKLLWQRRGGPGDSRLLGNGAMVSRWPARGGPVVRDGVVYFAAGIWPSEGIFIYALDAATGKVLWCNDDSGPMEWDQPHPGSRAKSGVAPQGYLAVTEQHLLVPNGRGVPAAFTRAEGKLEYFHLQKFGKPIGGAGIVATPEHFFNGKHLFDITTGMSRGAAPLPELIAAAPARVVFAADGQLTFQRWVEETVDEANGVKTKVKALRPLPPAPGAQGKAVPGRVGDALALAGDDYAETPAFGFDYNNITIAAWVRPSRLDGRFTVFDNRNVRDCPGLEIGTASGKGKNRIAVITPGVFAVETENNVIAAGQWTHIAYTRGGPGNTHKIYVNGVEQKLATAKPEAFASTPTPKDIGRRGNGRQNFQGAIDELAVFSRALGGAEIATVFKAAAQLPLREGLALYMPMDAPSPAEASIADLSGQEHHGVLFTKGGLAAPHEVISVIMVGDAVVLGGPGRVSLIQGAKTAWSAEVEGNVHGLAFAGDRLYASTDRGMIYCFGQKAGTPPVAHKPAVAAPDDANAHYAAAADEIIKKSGVREGYAVDLACGDGALACELAKRTNLKIFAIDSNPDQVRAAREKLEAAGLYGARVTVHLGDPANSNYTDYFADLVVSGRSLTEPSTTLPQFEISRMQRPWGGVACLGKPGAMTASVRGALEGAGDWTHQYCDPANTAVSSDRIVKSPLGMLWFRDYANLLMASRHGRPPAPLFSAGRLIVMGQHGLHAFDAYNGRHLWSCSIPDILTSYDQEHLLGTAITGGSFCLEGSSVYARVRDRVVRINAATGEKQAEFPLPGAAAGEDRRWGYLAVEGGTIFGSSALRDHVVRWAFKEAEMPEQLSESGALFALDAATGAHKWTYTARHSIRHNTIAVGAGRVYLIDRPVNENDKLATEGVVRGKLSWSKIPRKGEPKQPQAPGELVALDAATGNVLWRRDGAVVFGTMLALSLPHDLLLMTYQHNHAFRLPSEIGGRMAALRASDGTPVWDVEAEYNERPIINGTTIYAQPGAWDLLTGAQKDFTFTRSYGCGTVAGSTHLLAFRSGVTGFRDLTRPDSQTENYGGIRPGCWINAIPVGGLLLQPDATEKCTCGYLNKCFIALQPMGN